MNSGPDMTLYIPAPLTQLAPDSPSPNPTYGIYPPRQWETLVQAAYDSELDALAHYLESNFSVQTPESRRDLDILKSNLREDWLWFGKQARNSLLMCMQGFMVRRRDELSSFITRNIQPAANQIQSYTLMNLSPDRIHELSLKLTQRATPGLYDVPLARVLLQMGGVVIEDLADPSVVQALMEFQKRDLKRHWAVEAGEWRGWSGLGERVARLLEEMFVKAEGERVSGWGEEVWFEF
ncbi:hypothetical protein HDV00_000161 [Rhizophlyctis rosea]|nr:hypothetical protein HDV00_000161 [Rhizophlyctis rosea]